MGFLDRLKQPFGYEPAMPDEPQSLLHQINSNLSEATTLTVQQRAWLFGGSMVFAIVSYGLGIVSLMFMMNIRSGILFFTIGNISALGATCFVVGPAKQFRTMFTKDRMMSAVAFILAMILTLIAAVKCRNFFSVLIFVVPSLLVQIIAILWYCSTYVPGGQGMFKRIIGAADLDNI